MAVALSVVVATYNSLRHLELTLESYTQQTWRDFELICVDDQSSDQVGLLCRSLAAALPIKYLATPGIGRNAARNRGVRAADGELVLLAGELGVVEPGALESLASTGAGSVAVLRRAGFLSFWETQLSGAITRRLVNALVRRPELGRAIGREVWGDVPVQRLVTASDIRHQLKETLAGHAVDDLVWERLAPVLDQFGPELNGFALPWLFGLSGYLCADRDALFEVGLLDERATSWELEDADLAYRLHRAGLRFHVAGARVFHQLRPLRSSAQPEVSALERLAARDAIDAWLLARFLAHEDVRELAALAQARNGAAPAAEAALEEACAGLMPSLVAALRDAWRLA